MNLEEVLNKEQPREEQDTRPRYVIRDAAFALQPQPSIKWLIDQLIQEGTITAFFGDGGSKKTYSMLSLAVCAALGKQWLGFNCNPIKVLIIDEESGERRLTQRLAAAIRGELGADANPKIQYVSLAGFSLDNKADQIEVENLIVETGAQLVIIDALADIMTGDENSKADTQPVFTAVRKIAEKTRAAIVIIHHANKTGGYRGSTAIKGAVDGLIKIESVDGSSGITFKSEKMRDSEALNWSAVATWTEDQFYLSMADTLPKTMNISQAYVIKYLEENGDSAINDICSAADVCSSRAAKGALYKLADAGTIHRTNPQERGIGKSAIYAITK